MMPRATASICCSPPLNVPVFWVGVLAGAGTYCNVNPFQIAYEDWPGVLVRSSHFQIFKNGHICEQMTTQIAVEGEPAMHPYLNLQTL